jgi:hypothetical protein
MKRILIIVLVVLAGAACLLFHIISRTEIPHNQLIGNWRTKTQAFTLSPANGHFYTLVLGVAKIEPYAKPPVLDGHILIRKGQTAILEFGISSTNATPCNWLVHESECRAGYILTNKDLDAFLKPNETYSVELSSEAAVPEGLSLWLCCLQYFFDARRTK